MRSQRPFAKFSVALISILFVAAQAIYMTCLAQSDDDFSRPKDFPQPVKDVKGLLSSGQYIEAMNLHMGLATMRIMRHQDKVEYDEMREIDHCINKLNPKDPKDAKVLDVYAQMLLRLGDTYLLAHKPDVAREKYEKAMNALEQRYPPQPIAEANVYLHAAQWQFVQKEDVEGKVNMERARSLLRSQHDATELQNLFRSTTPFALLPKRLFYQFMTITPSTRVTELENEAPKASQGETPVTGEGSSAP